VKAQSLYSHVTGFSRWVKGQAQGLQPGGFKLWVKNWIQLCTAPHQGGELVNRGEHVDQLVQALGEQLELPEDLLCVKVELLPLGLRLQTIARQPVLLLVVALQVACERQTLKPAF
jgi:hypothetical protein